jgi:hypothetical protein
MNITKEKLLRIINEEIESVKEVEFKGDPMYDPGTTRVPVGATELPYRTGLGSENTYQDFMDAPPTIEERLSDLIMSELEQSVQQMSGQEAGPGMDEDLLAIAMRIRDKIMPQVGPVITGALQDAQAALQDLHTKLQEKKKR